MGLPLIFQPMGDFLFHLLNQLVISIDKSESIQKKKKEKMKRVPSIMIRSPQAMMTRGNNSVTTWLEGLRLVTHYKPSKKIPSITLINQWLQSAHH